MITDETMKQEITRLLRSIIFLAQVGTEMAGDHTQACSVMLQDAQLVLSKFEEGIVPDVDDVMAMHDRLEVSIKLIWPPAAL